MGIDEALVKRVLKLVNTNEYKRNQFCPIIRVSVKRLVWKESAYRGEVPWVLS